MKIRIDPDVLENPAMWDHLDHIVYIFACGQHLWQVDDPDVVERSQWIRQDIQGRAGQRNSVIMRKAYTDAIYPKTGSFTHSITLTVTLNVTNNGELLPQDAVRCMSEKAIVLVENAESDGAFLDAMIDAMNRLELLDAKEKGWWTIEHMGGFGEVEKRVAQYRANRPGPFRVLVLTDSDSLYPGHETLTMKKVRQCYQLYGVPCFILSKRKMENYLPIDAVRGTRRRATFNAYLRLDEEQKDHYEMKGGFEIVRGVPVIPPEQAELFRNVHRHVIRNLCGGFGKEVWKLFRDSSEHINEQGVRVRCSRDVDEIDRLLNAVESLI